MPVRFTVTALKYTDSTGHYPAYLCTLKREANITNDCPKPNKKPEKKPKMLSQWILIFFFFKLEGLFVLLQVPLLPPPTPDSRKVLVYL